MLQIVVVFYVAIVLLLIGTNLRAGRGNANGRSGGNNGEGNNVVEKRHVVEYSECSGKAENRIVTGNDVNDGGGGRGLNVALDYEDLDVADV